MHSLCGLLTFYDDFIFNGCNSSNIVLCAAYFKSSNGIYEIIKPKKVQEKVFSSSFEQTPRKIAFENALCVYTISTIENRQSRNFSRGDLPSIPFLRSATFFPIWFFFILPIFFPNSACRSRYFFPWQAHSIKEETKEKKEIVQRRSHFPIFFFTRWDGTYTHNE